MRLNGWGDKHGRIAGSFDVADSENEPCLWPADWISGEVRGWQVSQGRLSQAFNRISGRLYFLSYDDDGIKVGGCSLGGTEETSFPDLPRPMPEAPAEDLSTAAGVQPG